MDHPKCYCWPDLIKELCDRKYVIIAKVYGSLTPNTWSRNNDRQSKIYYNLTRVVHLGKMNQSEDQTFMTASTPAHVDNCTVQLNLSRSYLITGKISASPK
ncbi:unnamed protein product [Cylicocyclus nassatus]|uniref:NTR domain-containing protein n=1 Tax=Cylicocyclus nassatus TaxID=53992 RepID=A0AA36H495_CYLNA|nr:unnamed protein product [Cylicocyclus nassatus]